MAETKNNSLSKDKVLSVFGLIIFVLLFIFSCLNNSLSVGEKLVGTFGFAIFPVSMIMAFICLIKFLGFSYKRSTKATVLMILFLFCLGEVIHCIKTFSALDTVVSKETFVDYLALAYTKTTILGSFGSLFSGAIAFLIGGVGAIVTFVISGTLFIGFFIDFELYGKYEQKHIKKIKTNKLRKKVMHSDDNLGPNGLPNYSFSNDLDKYSNEDVVAEITANVDEMPSEMGRKVYSPSDVVGEISDNNFYQNGNESYGGDYNNQNQTQTNPWYNYNANQSSNSEYYGNVNMFGRDAVVEQQENRFSNSFNSEPDYPDVYEENERRRQFMSATFDNGNNDYSSGNDYSESSSFSGYNFDNLSGYNSSNSLSGSDTSSSNNYYGNYDSSYSSNGSSYGSSGYGMGGYDSDNSYNSNSSYGSSSNSSSSYSSNSNYDNSYNSSYNDNGYSDSGSFNQDNVNNYEYGGLYNFPDSEPYVGVSKDDPSTYSDSEFNNSGYNSQSNNNGSSYGGESSYNTSSSYGGSDYTNNSYNSTSSTFETPSILNVEDKINNIVNSDDSLSSSSSGFGYQYELSQEMTNSIKDDVKNNFSFDTGSSSKSNFEIDTNQTFDFLTESMKEVDESYNTESSGVGAKQPDNNFSQNNFSSQKPDNNIQFDNSKVKITSQKSQKKTFSGYNMGMNGIRYNAPPLDLLAPTVIDTGNYEEEQERKAKRLEGVLDAFGIPVTVVNIVRGPKITRYELSVPLGVSIKKIPSYELDIKKGLATKTLAIKAPIPGSEFVGIELENDKFSNVGLRELFESDNFKNSQDPLPIAIGKDISGEVVVKSLVKMVHLLIAGQTGSGKSVFVHSTILSLIYKYSPDDLRLILIDPKRVEFNRYNG